MARLIGQINDAIARDFVPVLTGAGASAAFGFPMMDRAVHLLTEHLGELPEIGPVGGETDRRGRLRHYKNWIDEEARNLGFLLDLETFLVSLDIHIDYVRRGMVHGLARRILGDLNARPLIGNDTLSPLDALLDLRLAYMDFVHNRYGRHLLDEARNSAQQSFQALTQALHPQPYCLFTTNYDTVAEAVPEMLGKSRIDGFTTSMAEGPETWTEHGFDDYTSFSDQMPVFHLHGAASWFVVNGEVRRYPGLGRLTDPNESLLLYPGQSAKDQVADDAVPDPLRVASDYFARAVSTQKRLITIGYSFRDAGIIQHIDRAAAFAKGSIRVQVIAPYRTPGVDRLFELGTVKGQFIPALFEEPQNWKDPLADQIDTQT